MSIARTALRLVVVEAIKGATIAGQRVFDSRIEDIQPDQFKDDQLPTAILLTDRDEGDALSKQNGGPPFGREVELSFQLCLTQRIHSEDEDEADPSIAIVYPDTDARLEAALDIFEFQIIRRLQFDHDPACELFRRFWRIQKYESHRQTIEDASVKVAARLFSLHCYSSDDQVKTYNTGIDDLPTGYNVLPDPLKSVCEIMPDDSASKNICDIMAAAVTNLVLPPLDGVDIQVDASLDDEGGSEMVDVSVEIQSALSVAETVAIAGQLVIDYQRGTFQRVILAGDVTSMVVKGWPRAGKTGRLILQITNTGNYEIQQWPVTTLWTGGGSQPVVSKGVGKRDIFVLTAADGGVEFFANVVGQDYSET